MSLAESNVRDIFLYALEVSDQAKRMAWVEQVCAQNIELRDAVARLLRHHDSLEGFMALPAPEMRSILSELSAPDEEPLQPGTTIDRYLLAEAVGRGGMGTVFRAHQLQPVERIVALKILRSGTTSPAAVQRFEKEQQSLAQMNHPGIVSVLDAGLLSDGRPYFVMNFVDGHPITQFCRERGLPLTQRIRLMIDLCEAVQHTHYRGIIHHDLKPANILTTWIDERAVCRLIDFGIRRDLFGSSDSQTGLVAGTPAYMSPEQVTLGSIPPDTRSDIYALGVVLTELLFGTPDSLGPPGSSDTHESADQPDPESSREKVADAKTPTFGGRFSAGEHRTLLSMNCKVGDSAVLSSTQSHELISIVRKARQASPADRYSSATELADDLGRFLAGEIVKAVPVSGTYRVRKFVCRNRLPLALAGTTLLSLVVGLVISLIHTRTAREAEMRVSEYLKESRILERRYQTLAWESTIRQAYIAWEARNLLDAQELLLKLDNEDRAADRFAEWGLLWSELQSLYVSHTIGNAAITEVRRLPSRNLIVTACGDGLLRFLDADTMRVVRSLETGIPSLHAIAVNAKENLIAVGGSTDLVSDRSFVRIFDMNASEWIDGFPPQLTTIETLEFFGDSEMILCGARYENPQIFRISDRSVARTVPADRRNRWSAIAHDGSMAAVEQSSKSIRLLNLSSPVLDQTIEMPLIQSYAFWLPANNRLYCILEHTESLVLFDVEQQRMIALLEGTESVSRVCPSVDGISMLAATNQGEILVWELPSDLIHCAQEFRPHSALSQPPSSDVRHLPVIAAKSHWTVSRYPLQTLTDSESFIFAGNQNGEIVRIRKQPPRLEELQLTGRSGSIQVKNSEWSGDGRALLLGSNTGEVLRLDWPSDIPVSAEGAFSEPFRTTRLLNDQEPSGPLLGLSMSSNAHKIALWNQRTDLIVSRDLRTGAEVQIAGENPNRESGDTERLAYSPHGDRLAWTVGRNILLTSPHQSGPGTRTQECPGLIFDIKWINNGQALLIGGQFDGLLLWSEANNDMNPLPGALNHTSCIQVSGDSSIVVAGHFDGSVRVWRRSAENYQVAAFAQMHDAQILGICLLNDNRIAVSIDKHLEVAVWLTQTGQKIGVLSSIRTDLNHQPSHSAYVKLAVQQDSGRLILSMIDPETSVLLRTWTIGESKHSAARPHKQP